MDTASPKIMLTATELDSHRRELERLLQIRDRDLPQLLRDARTFVAADAAEETVQIREDQAVIETRITRLETLLRSARVITDEVAPGVVSVGRVVEVQYLRTGKVVAYLVTGTAMFAATGTLSAQSPLGKALVGRVAGDAAFAVLPTGRVEALRIRSVKAAHEGLAA